MAYLQTTAVSVSDILDSIATFATSLGWTVARNNTYTSGATTQRILSLSRVGFDYAHFASNLSASHTEILTMRSISFSGAGALSTEPEKSTAPRTNLITAGAYVNLWLFGDSGTSPYIHCVIEHAAGRYRHFGIGNLVKKGTWTGGGYNHCTFWEPAAASSIDSGSHVRPFSEFTSAAASSNHSIRCDDADRIVGTVSGVDNRYAIYNPSMNNSNYVATGLHTTSYTSPMMYVYGMGYVTHTISSYNQRVSLINISNFVTRAAGYMTYIGDTPDVRAVNTAPFQAGEEYTIGSDVWKIFPMIRTGTGSGSGDENSWSGFAGLAYRKIV